MHTSAKARLTSVAIGMPIRIRIRIRTLIRDPDRHQNLTICSLAHCQPYLKISCKSVWPFLRKGADRQSDKKTDKQTTTKTTSLAEVKITIALSRTLALSHFWTVITTNNHETHVKQSTDCIPSVDDIVFVFYCVPSPSWHSVFIHLTITSATSIHVWLRQRPLTLKTKYIQHERS